MCEERTGMEIEVHVGSHRLAGLVVKASASVAEDPGFESCLRLVFFSGRVIPVT